MSSMSPLALQALKKSIAKWQKVLSREAIDIGARNCDLCQAFPGENCEGCPVAESAHASDCENTPYTAWIMHQIRAHNRNITPRYVDFECADCKYLAQDELDYLVRLLPPGETP